MKLLLSILLIFFFSLEGFSQKGEEFKTEAIKQMQLRKYGEAIDLLNKYITAYPQRADGLNLRGLCYEARGQLERATLDLRLARKLAPNDSEIAQNLARVEKKWYDELYLKIDGHLREIAINPNTPINYLEIGKCKKHLGLWGEAEEWYDEYIKREDPSADEVIRYTEILARNNHIQKGEIILKKYVERYPNDNRLWSRYGYFTMWLGKTKIAIEAFERALEIRPFFKEALDGLDLAKGKGYIYTVYDTTQKFRDKPEAPREYAIDRYYRILKNNPNDDDTRFMLIDSLILVNRLEEAYEQLKIMQYRQSGNEYYISKLEFVENYRDSIYREKVEEYKTKFENNPRDREAAIQLADYYGRLQDYDMGIEVYEKYFSLVDDPNDLETKYRFAQLAAWNREFSRAFEPIDHCLRKEPNNLKYQLFRAQISVWSNQDLEIADGLLNNVLSKDPENFDAIITMGLLKLQQLDFDASKFYIEKAKSISPEHPGLVQLENNFELQLLRAEEHRVYMILEAGREKVYSDDCEGGLRNFDEYFEKTDSKNRYILREYAQVNACVGNFDKSLSIYDQLLNDEYELDVDIERAKTIYQSGDSLKSLTEFQRLFAESPNDFWIQLYLGDSYAKMQQWSNARVVYESILETNNDSLEISYVKSRLGWLPITGFRAILANFPNYVAVAPFVNYYSDNQNLKYNLTGLRAEVGLSSFLSVGAYYGRTQLFASDSSKIITTNKFFLQSRISQFVIASVGFGSSRILNEFKGNVFDIFLKYEKEKLFTFTGTYERNDARVLLASPFLLNTILEAEIFRINGTYFTKSGLKLSGYYQFIGISDGNKGNDLLFRVGKEFYKDLFMGYEYFYQSYKNLSTLYYTPQNFESHSIWGDYLLEKTDEYELTAGGKLGYVPASEVVVRELYGQAQIKVLDNFVVNARATYGSSIRFDSNYSSLSFALSAFWNFY